MRLTVGSCAGVMIDSFETFSMVRRSLRATIAGGIALAVSLACASVAYAALLPPVPTAIIIQNYRAVDLGQPGVPQLSNRQKRQLKKVLRSVPHDRVDHIRFAFAGPEGSTQKQLVIYDDQNDNPDGSPPGNPKLVDCPPVINAKKMLYNPRFNFIFPAN